MSLIREIAGQQALAADLFEALRRDGEQLPPGITRDPYGAGEDRAHATAEAAARDLGLEIARDAAANTYFTLPGRDRAAPRLVIGSHLDSVPHGGNFDGAAGVVAGLVIAAAMKRAGIVPPSDLTVMAIRAEESIWFEVSYIGSRAALGMLPPGALEARRRDTGRSLADHIASSGGQPAVLGTDHAHLGPASVRAFLELHIEQAPSLVEAGKPVAICTGIPGNVRYPNARIEGAHDHVGLPRRFRRDAAMAGADFAMALDAVWAEHEAAGIPMAATLGRFHTDSEAHGLTIVPGAFAFSLDVRAYDPPVLAELDRRVSALMREVAERRRVAFHPGAKAGAAVGRVEPAWRAALERSADRLGVPWMPLGSPASHDAAAFAAAGVPMAMVFVRNENGSHNPREAMAIDDFMAGVSVLGQAVQDAPAT